MTLKKIAVIKETYQAERRVSITPNVAKILIQSGWEIVVEFNAGLMAGFSNQDYQQVGAKVTQSKTILYYQAMLVIWVKPPIDSVELTYMPTNVGIIGFTNPFKEQSIHHLGEQFQVNFLSLELLSQYHTIAENINALAKMSCFAGRIAYKEAIKRSIYTSHKVLIVGSGYAGIAAANEVYLSHHQLVVASTNQTVKTRIEQLKGTYITLPKTELIQQQRLIKKIIEQYQPNIIITTARRVGQLAPILFPIETLNTLPKNSIIMDLTASIGGNTEYTVFDKDIQLDNGLWICNKSNYPNTEAKQASIAYAECIANLLLYNEVIWATL